MAKRGHRRLASGLNLPEPEELGQFPRDQILISESHTAKALGKSTRTLRRWRSRRWLRISPVKIGGSVSYQLCDLLDFIEKSKVRAPSKAAW
jgi:hypothetical protein